MAFKMFVGLVVNLETYNKTPSIFYSFVHEHDLLPVWTGLCIRSSFQFCVDTQRQKSQAGVQFRGCSSRGCVAVNKPGAHTNIDARHMYKAKIVQISLGSNPTCSTPYMISVMRPGEDLLITRIDLVLSYFLLPGPCPSVDVPCHNGIVMKRNKRLFGSRNPILQNMELLHCPVHTNPFLLLSARTQSIPCILLHRQQMK